MNSSAALKGFCGQHGGIVCTSSNATRGSQVGTRARPACALLPRPTSGPQHRKGDRHPARADAALGPQQAARRQRSQKPFSTPASSFGMASVRCTSASLSARSKPPDSGFLTCASSCIPSARCRWSMQPTQSGSTDFITKAIAAAPAGSTFAIGTEINLVQRLANQNPQHKIFLSRLRRLPLFDHVPNPPQLHRVGAGGARSRQRAQPQSR